MYKALQLFVCLLVASAGMLALAAPPLSLHAAIDTARANHPALQAAHADVTAASANLRGARTLRNPEILVTPGVLGPAGSDEFLSIAQPLEINGAKRARTNIATGQLEATQAERRVTEQAVIFTVKTAYWNLAQAQALTAFDAENVTYAETLVAAAKKQVELGNEPTSHVTKADVELARARQQLARSQAAIGQAQTALNAAMGRNPNTPITLADTLAYSPMTLDDDTLIQQGIANRPELLRDQALVAAASGEVDAARAARRPDVAVQVRRESWHGDGGVGLGISLPLIDWGAARAERDRARASVTAQQRRVEATRLAVRQEISAAVIAARSAEAQIITLRDQVLKPAETLAQMASTGYQEGAMTYLEVLEARRTLRAVNVEYLSALGEYRTALAQVEWATGTTLRPAPPKEVQP
ncbi:MAG TPA: TolC family protein [Armatimonadota bacterium]|jgi:cobalt-zinc-cadmium efflux system outer membrane protein